MTWQTALAVAAAVLALAGIGLGIWVARRQSQLRAHLGPGAARHTSDEPGEPRPDGPRPLVAVVANPAKPGAAGLRERVTAAVAARGWPEPLWLETTPEDPGVGQARSALDSGAQLVVAAGGDGTVRAVAEALAHTGVPMGLLPQGTGNLLARNLDLPLGPGALAIALDGVDRTIDVGRLHVERWADAEPPPGAADEHIFLVIGGVGVDAAMVADADEQLKARVGWIAYFVAAVRHLHGHRLRVKVRVDDRDWIEVRGRSLLVGNVGRLPGGITLLPDARIDDGWLDLAALDARGGVAGWAQLLGEVMLQRIGVRNDLPAKIGRIDHVRARRVQVQIVGGDQVQVDGDSVGRVKQMSAQVDPGALVVRVAPPKS
ncbi:MAG TPA: diacylglycerol kinase family protein [Cellulomonas sp.]